MGSYRVLMFGAAICNALAAAVMLTAWIVKAQPTKPIAEAVPSIINVGSIAHLRPTPQGLLKPVDGLKWSQ